MLVPFFFFFFAFAVYLFVAETRSFYFEQMLKHIKPLSQCAISVDQVNVEACKAVHVGDDQKADKEGANAIGIDCW